MKIESKRLILRNWEDGDIEDIVEGLNNIEVAKWMAGVPYPYTENDADIFLYGHTHTFSVKNINDKLYINTGALGCPMKSNLARAGILEINDEKIQFKSINVEYNVKEIIDEINNLKFPFYEKILKIFY